MINNLYELKKGDKCSFQSCEDSLMKKELFAYGFLVGVEIKVLSKNKEGLVVEVLDTLYSINRCLATQILVRVVKGE